MARGENNTTSASLSPNHPSGDTRWADSADADDARERLDLNRIASSWWQGNHISHCKDWSGTSSLFHLLVGVILSSVKSVVFSSSYYRRRKNLRLALFVWTAIGGTVSVMHRFDLELSDLWSVDCNWCSLRFNGDDRLPQKHFALSLFDLFRSMLSLLASFTILFHVRHQPPLLLSPFSSPRLHVYSCPSHGSCPTITQKIEGGAT